MRLTKKQILATISIGTLPLAYGFYRWVNKLSAAPVEDKKCDFIYPIYPEQTLTKQLEYLDKVFTKHFTQRGGSDDDASCLNKTPIYGKVKVNNATEVQEVINFAIEKGLSISAAGVQHTMGGHTLAPGGIVMDISGLNQMQVVLSTKILKVGSGATWEQVQQYLDPLGLSVHAMQSINVFTVGGTLSVNAHGMDHSPGHIAPTVQALTVVLADGEIKRITPESDPELFSGILGGYGLLGIILEAEIKVVDNEAYQLKSTFMDYRDFTQFYETEIKDNPDIGLFYGRLSVAPHSYLTESVAHVYSRTEIEYALPPVKPWNNTKRSRFVVNLSKSGGAGRWIRWMLEKYVQPRVYDCITRNQAMGERESHCIVSRNQEMSDSMGYLKNNLADTDILNEYFVPRENMVAFVDGLKAIVKRNNANLLNVSIRIVEKDTITDLPYATEDMFAYVLYFNQKLNEKESLTLTKTTQELIDLSASLGGTYYLPYQTVYSHEQLAKVYPNIQQFWDKKAQYDPNNVFANKWFNLYSKAPSDDEAS